MANGIINNQLPISSLGLKGATPPQRAGAKGESQLHYESSINNSPAIDQTPSVLDLNGVTPSKYSDNQPQ
tara:strand:- start:3094 stop:3303 length:210 start_codon:yes stop_codon:yes gene_type:complete